MRQRRLPTLLLTIGCALGIATDVIACASSPLAFQVAQEETPPTPVEDETPEPPPTEEEIDAALEALAEGLDKDSPEDKIAAIQAAAGVKAKQLAKAIARATDSKLLEVQLAALDALGRMDIDPALAELERLAKRAKKLTKNDELCAELYKAMGRYGSEQNLALFAKKAFQNDRPKTNRACILAFGKVRTDESLKELISMMNRAPILQGKGQTKWHHWSDLNLALRVLTGADVESERKAWQAWWNENKKSFRVPADEPELDKKFANAWRTYWEGPREPRKKKGDGEKR
jgi:HEAT repeat protein